MTQHKCRVFKSYYQGFSSGRLLWLASCYNRECYYSKAYIYNKTWEETMLDALVHRKEHS